MADKLDPAEFVERIRQLGEQRDQEDENRVRRLEEEIIQGRSERLARRAERARSLSPEKPTPPQQTPRSSHAQPRRQDTKEEGTPKLSDTPTPVMEPSSSQQAARDASLQRLTGSNPAQALEDLEPKKPTPSAAALGRSGTLSWQRRPQSGTGSIRRPLSGMSTSTSPDRTSFPPPQQEPSEPSSPAASPTPSRAQIAQSLSSKDPTWFRQTPDRGIGSAAYRRNQDENLSDIGSISTRRQLPGMPSTASADRDLASPPPETPRSVSPSRASSVRGSAAFSNRFSTNTSISGGDAETVAKTRSPLPVLDSQKFAPPSEQGTPVDGGDHAGSPRTLAMSPTQGRISPERTDRPVSPTKGMGGFVQSAMLKRSDSVSKRWSTQTPQPLNRQNSTMSNRVSVALGGYGAASRIERPSSLSRDNSIEPSSRPASSASNITITKGLGETDPKKDTDFARPALPRHSRSKSVASTFSEDNRPHDDADPPSPAKRWSPTKSSWLESALSKPESPKPKQPPPQQPSWMAEINRKRQEKGSVDMGKSNPLQSPPADSSASGRSSPIKEVQLRPVSARIAEGLKRADVAEPAKESPKPKPILSPKPTAAVRDEPAPEKQPEEEPKPNDVPKEMCNPKEEPQEEQQPVSTKESTAAQITQTPPKPSSLASATIKKTTAAPPTTKSKPDTPPKKDFRAGLRSRQVAPEQPKSGSNELSEFQNVFGRLKKAETKNYVAPDTLKDNILRGKSALAVSGGPQPSARRDEFRDSLVSKKAAMLAKAQENGSAALKKPDIPASNPTTPEAIAKRKLLGRSDSISRVPPPKEPEPAPIPEALTRKKSLRSPELDVAEKKAESPPSLSSVQSAKPSKLADRFNPALAGLLARGPPPMATAPSSSPSSQDSPQGSNTRAVAEEKAGPAPELTHMTKGRARGPKRRAPAAKQAAKEKEPVTPQKVAPVATSLPKTTEFRNSSASLKDAKAIQEEPAAKVTSARDSIKSKPETPTKSHELSRKIEKVETPSKSPELPRKAEKPGTPSKSHEVARKLEISDTSSKSEVSKKAEKSSSPDVPRKKPSLDLIRRVSGDVKQPSSGSSTEKPQSPVPSPKAAATWRASKPLPSPPATSEAAKPTPGLQEIPTSNGDASPTKEADTSSRFSVKNATALWGRQSATSSSTATRTRSPVKLPTRADEQKAMEEAGLSRSEEVTEKPQPKTEARTSNPVGLGLGSFASSFGGLVGARSRESSPPKIEAPKTYPISPPASGNRPKSEPFEAPPKPAPGSTEELLAQFFDEPPITTGELPSHIDTTHILKSPPLDLSPSAKIRSLRRQMQEITGDGKLLAIPPQEEHVLFQDSMYLCTHTFSDSKGARHTEVYLWAGNGVADPTLEDAQLFARTTAKQNQAKLLVLRQGKETPNFFEALGGIVITRRGSRPGKSTEYMLCGRKHLGHIAFDEVEFSLKSLCSGFAYIVPTQSGKVFIWTGRGCSAEEVSGARLIGMDLLANGDLDEIEEGKEPQAFLDAFPPAEDAGSAKKGPAIPRSADHWRYKASCDKYRARLFKVEQYQTGSGGAGGSGWGQSLQVSSFFAPLLRRPSWQGAAAVAPPSNPVVTASGTLHAAKANAEQRPQTPVTPKSPMSPGGGITTKVVEIMPFVQRDLEPEGVYVLDAFFEVYIILGPLTSAQPHAFATALLFAQDYSILAVSEEDRPFLPVCTVVLEGVPRDMKAVFRFWDDAYVPAGGLMRGRLGRGKSLRVLGLERALRVTRGGGR
ncbi:uncharacterized protein EI97DRAFT_433067 [Westerdykella ornata]|uniref:Uncharacterized protein n=1 Tax=Westerdykella ornata TaxID=318751 RepID=A0A6A6JKP5_WESOR|nr:uncharacterized protein EI97DRAFT_433067 [Westerdykella ornata]KAF2276834.1 hypothetical protein EI97DRAFT_433067 [Westerdykella ornata]